MSSLALLPTVLIFSVKVLEVGFSPSLRTWGMQSVCSVTELWFMYGGFVAAVQAVGAQDGPCPSGGSLYLQPSAREAWVY